MHAVVAVRRLRIRSVEVVRRIRYVAIRGSLVRLTSPSATQRLVGMVEPASYRRQTLVPGVVERMVGLRSPEPVLLGDELLDLIQDGLLVHNVEHNRRAGGPTRQPADEGSACTRRPSGASSSGGGRS